MNVLITGANGLLGQHLTLFLAGKDHKITACSRGECRIPDRHAFLYYAADLTNREEVNALIRETNPAVIIHAAAMSKPDECNTNRDECILQNVESTRYLLENCQQNTALNRHFIYISTDFVFGEDGPHAEDDAPGPLNFYGESKLKAEELVKKSDLNFSIVRPVFIYGEVWQGLRSTFLHWVKQNLEEGKKIKVVSDQLRTPTYARDICQGIETISRDKRYGVYHLAGKDIISPYNMAVTVAETLNLDAALIENVTSDTFIEPVKRARRSGLKIDKARELLSYDPVGFTDGVKLTFNIW